MPDSGSPLEPDRRGQAKTTALARLRQAIWEADQFLTGRELVQFFDDVRAEIEGDRP